MNHIVIAKRFLQPLKYFLIQFFYKWSKVTWYTFTFCRLLKLLKVVLTFYWTKRASMWITTSFSFILERLGCLDFNSSLILKLQHSSACCWHYYFWLLIILFCRNKFFPFKVIRIVGCLIKHWFRFNRKYFVVKYHQYDSWLLHVQ